MPDRSRQVPNTDRSQFVIQFLTVKSGVSAGSGLPASLKTHYTAEPPSVCHSLGLNGPRLEIELNAQGPNGNSRMSWESPASAAGASKRNRRSRIGVLHLRAQAYFFQAGGLSIFGRFERLVNRSGLIRDYRSLTGSSPFWLHE